MRTINTLYINFAKRLATIVLLCTMGIGMAQAGTDYAIVFNNGDNDTSYDTKVTSETALIAEGGKYVTGIDENTAINTYRSQKSLKFGLRLGNYKATGSLTMTLAENYRMPASKIALNVAHYYDEVKKKSDTGGLRVTATYTDGTTTICDITIDPNANGKKGSTTDHHVVRLIPEKTLEKVTLASINPNYGRVYCKNLTIYSAPKVTKPTATKITKTTATLTSKVTDLGSSATIINLGYGFVISSVHTTPTKSACERSIRKGETYTTTNNEFSTNLTGLTPGTTYYARAYVTKNDSENGWDTYSAQTTTFRTKGHVATFNAGAHGTCATTSTEEVSNTAGITLPDVTPNNSGWNFLGWSTSPDAEIPDAGSAGTNYDLTDDITFYAVYEDATQYVKYRTSCPVTITWLVAGEVYTAGNPTTEVYPTQSITTLPTDPTAMLVGCCADEFVGWTTSTAQPIKASDILNDDKIRALSIESNTTFYAVFTKAGGDGYVTYCYIKDYVCGEIQVNGTPVVTSTAGQKVKLNVPITLTSLLGIKTTITGSSDNDNFEVDALPNVAAGDHIVTIHYTPTAATDGIETATITLQASAGNNATTTFQVKGRHLPKNFVIAAKEGDEWVALTAAIESRTTQKALPIAVDNQTTPTKATMASNKALYNLLALDTRYTANGTAVHLYSTINNKVLNPYAGSSTKTDLNTGSNHDNAQDNEKAPFYEWNLVSEDLMHYTITNCNQEASWEKNRFLGYNVDSGKWGTYATAANVNQDIFLLPVETTINETDIEVMEWGTNSMVLRLGDIASDILNITLNGTKSQKTLTRLNGSDLYRVSGLTLTDNHCKTMIIADASNNGIIVRKPIIVSGQVSSTDYCPNCDVVVLKDGKLTANTYVDYANIYVYPGGKLVLDGKSLGAKQQVYLRGGFSWLNQTDDNYALPEVYLNGSINFAGSENIIYDYYIKNYQYFQFALPYTVPLAKVTDEAGVDNFPVWVKHYNGELRAADAYATSWEWYNGANFERGIGYIIAAQPRQVGSTANRPLSIIRFPLGNEELNTSNIEPNLEDLSTTAHGIDGYKAGTVTANNVGWHLLGNPFMATWKGDIGHNELKKHPNDANWDGSYYWAEESSVKYITIMSAVSGTDYAQYIAKDRELKPFFPFFMQEVADSGTGSISFDKSNRIKKAPAAIYTDEPREAFVQIEMLTEGVDDQTGLFISDTYSNDIDLDDYEKMFGSSTDNAKLWLVHEDKRMAFEAMTETAAATNIALGYRAPKAGNYIFAINEEVSTLHDVVAVYLTDHEMGVRDYNLLYNAYEFESQSTNYNDNRFTIRIVLNDNSDGTMTSVGNLGTKHEDTYKFIYEDKMYIYNSGVIYDATGKQVTNINK